MTLRVPIESVQLECQYYSQAPALYDADNDCAAVEAYFRAHHPTYRLKAHVSNCATAEYNLVASTDPNSPLDLFEQIRLPHQPKAMINSKGQWRGGELDDVPAAAVPAPKTSR